MGKRDSKRGYRDLIILILIILLIIIFVFIGFKITGRVVSESGVQVYRLVDGNNVKLSIVSSENVLAIQENFSSEECKVVNYSIEPEIEIFVFKETDNTWILANRSDNLIAELSYNLGSDLCGGDVNRDGVVSVDDMALVQANFGKVCLDTSCIEDLNGDEIVSADDLAIVQANFGKVCSDNNIGCSVVSGKYFIISGEGLGEGYLGGEEKNETQEENETQTTPSISVPSGGSSGGGGGGGGSGGGISAGAGEPEMLSDEIVEVENEKELEGAVEGAIRRISGEETPGQIRKGNVFLAGILILIVISIIIFLVVSFSRKPKK